MEIVNIKIDKLKPAEYNPRLDLQPEDKEYQDIKRSIVEFGLVEPLVINKDMTVIGGHQRLKVLRDLNHTTIPCITVDLDKQKEKMLNIALNKISGDWDRAKLKDILEELDTGEFDVCLTGFGEQEIEDLMTEFHVEPEEDDFDADKAVEEAGEPICKRGDLWQLGEHRLLCGDATSREDVKRLMDGENNYSMLTDPPYNIGFNYKSIDDKKSDEDYKIFCISWFNMFKPKSLIFTPGPKNERYYPEPKDEGIWIKRNATAGASCFYLRLAEPLLFYGEFKEKRNTDIFDYSTGFPNELKKTRQESGIIKDYAPVKSIPLWVELIKMLNNKIVVDCFLGNGTTLIACEQLNRICYGMEIDPIYCDVIIKRWEQYTNKKAVKIS